MFDIVNRGLARLSKASVVAAGEVGSARAPANLGCGRFGRARFTGKRTGAVSCEGGEWILLSGGQTTGGGTDSHRN